MKKKLCAALAAMVLFLFFGCSSGGTDGSGEIPQNPGINQGGEQKPDQGGESGGGEGENPGDGESEEGENNTPSETIANVEDVIKLVIGEDGYEKLYNSGKFVPTSITLTAQTIEDIGANFSGLSTYENKEKDIKNISDIHKEFISNYKEAIVAQYKGLINITTSKLDSYTIPVKFDGTFNLSEISLPTTNDGKGDFANATLTNNGESITIDKLNTIRGNSLPILKFDKNETNVKETDTVSGENIYNLYKAYSYNLGKIQIKGTMSSSATVNGKKISGDDEYTLLSDVNTVKLSTDTSVKSLPLDALIQMYKQLKIAYFLNMIISGDAKEATDVDWTLTNIVFEGDMSKIKNTGNKELKGIVYFKDKVYYNTPGQSVYGLIKLDKLDGVSDGNFGVALNSNSAVLDVRNVAKNDIDKHNTNILRKGGWAHAIYFSNDFSSLKGSQSEINELCNRFSSGLSVGFVNAYLGDTRVDGPYIKNGTKGADTPRTLKDFEDYGNNRKFPNGEYYAQNDKSCGKAKRFV